MGTVNDGYRIDDLTIRIEHLFNALCKK